MRIYERTLEDFRGGETAAIDGRTRQQWMEDAQAAVGTMTRALSSGPVRLSLAQAQRALSAAVIHFEKQPPAYAEADALLDRAISSAAAVMREAEGESAQPDPVWGAIEESARGMRIVSLAGQQRFDEANSLLETLPGDDPARLLSVMAGLSGAAGSLSAQHREQLGRIELGVLSRLDAHRESFSEADRQRLDEAKATALAATHRFPDAIALFESILKKSPKDARLLRATAELIEEAGRPEDLTRAQGHWTQLARLYAPGSREWLEARYAMASSLLKAGRAEESRKLIETTKIVYPKLGGDDLKSRFEALNEQAAKGERPTKK